MKKTFLIVAGMLSLSSLLAQVKEGTVYFDRKMNMHRIIQDEHMWAMMPEFRTTKHMLLFKDSISVYKTVPEDEAPDPFAGGGGGGGIVMRFNAGGAGDLFKNFSQAKSIQSSEMGGKNFLIIDSIKQLPWKIGTETKQILGYTCTKATRKTMQPAAVMRTISAGGGGATSDTTVRRPQGKEVEVVAWYTESLISPGGPDSYGQLPGLILQLDIDNGATIYTATEVKNSTNPKDLVEPKKGKVVTRQEYQKLMMDMMGSQGPGGIRMSSNN